MKEEDEDLVYKQANNQQEERIDKEGRECVPATVKKKQQERRECVPATE